MALAFKHSSINKKHEVRTCLYGLNKANQYLTSKVLMDDDCNGGKDDYIDVQKSCIISALSDSSARVHFSMVACKVSVL